MNTFIHADLFFFISSVGFVVLFVLLAILILYATRALRTWGRILDKLEENLGTMGDTAQEMLEDVRESTVFRLLVGKRKSKK
jgi:hypothetical protein